MSQFQAQTQWENESMQSTNPLVTDGTETIEKKSGNTQRILLLLGIVVLAVVIIAVIAVHHFSRSVEGIWIRQVDNSNVGGMIVEVRQNGDMLQGTILSLPSGAPRFETGQIKWANISKTGYGEYLLYDLICTDTTEDSGVRRYYHYGDTESQLTVQPGGKVLIISQNSQPSDLVASDEIRVNVNLGSQQVWIRQK